MQALADPTTVEVMLNPDGTVWQERLGEPMKKLTTLRAGQARAVIESIAGYHGKTVTLENPLLEAELPPDGSRFAGQIPPVVSSPTFAIRKKAIRVMTIDDYIAKKIMGAAQADLIKSAVVDHKNILIIGGTGSGKTTLVNAVIDWMTHADPTERIVIIEDTAEIQCSAENSLSFQTSMNISMTQLLKTTLRMRPDRILVGEVRGAEALDLLMAWNTGHAGGAATLHANNALAGLSRLEMLVSMHQNAPKTSIPELIAEAVDVVIHIERHNRGRRISDVLRLSGYDATSQQYITEQLGEGGHR